jgi:hypothetical protein
MIQPPELSGKNQQKSGSEARETWHEIAIHFAYEVSLFIPVVIQCPVKFYDIGQTALLSTFVL